MASSDRTQYKQAIVGSIGDSRTITNGPLIVAQEAQRFVEYPVAAGLAANANLNASMARVDRPVQVKEVRILPGGTWTGNANTVFAYGYTNDNGGSFTTMGTINGNTAANGGTGNFAVYTSVVVTANTSINAVVPSGSHFAVQVTTTAPSVALPTLTFQVLWEEV